MEIKQYILEWLNELDDKSVFLVGVDWKPGSKKLSIWLDGDSGISIEQCRQANRILSAKLDETDFGDGQYTLEVSSPGADKPLLIPRQYAKHIGRELEVKLIGQSVMKGKLVACTDTYITLQLPDKKKKYSEQSSTKQIAWSDVLESVVIISFK